MLSLERQPLERYKKVCKPRDRFLLAGVGVLMKCWSWRVSRRRRDSALSSSSGFKRRTMCASERTQQISCGNNQKCNVFS